MSHSTTAGTLIATILSTTSFPSQQENESNRIGQKLGHDAFLPHACFASSSQASSASFYALFTSFVRKGFVCLGFGRKILFRLRLHLRLRPRGVLCPQDLRKFCLRLRCPFARSKRLPCRAMKAFHDVFLFNRSEALIPSFYALPVHQYHYRQLRRESEARPRREFRSEEGGLVEGGRPDVGPDRLTCAAWVRLLVVRHGGDQVGGTKRRSAQFRRRRGRDWSLISVCTPMRDPHPPPLSLLPEPTSSLPPLWPTLLTLPQATAHLLPLLGHHLHLPSAPFASRQA
ncbi:hypothetical protein M5K25_012062 [Dendrobium thyrsiflorum]|uniref:Uncharacterized protein n=1 Tax=Dendrobium thyrsiflorum TaxID=117978 RepID=A0ABD0V317_DENTH